MVSRRTASACSMRRSDHPSRPSARICCCVSLSKTLLIPAKDYTSIAFVNVSIATGNGRFSAVDQWPLLGVHRGQGLPRERVVDTVLLGAGEPYGFACGNVYNLESSTYICKLEGAAGAHNDIDGPEVAHAIWEAALASGADTVAHEPS